MSQESESLVLGPATYSKTEQRIEGQFGAGEVGGRTAPDPPGFELSEDVTRPPATGSEMHLQLLERDPLSNSFTSSKIDTIPTAIGPIRVAVQGEKGKPALLTYHDLGMNYEGCFGGLFSAPAMARMLDFFCVYHVNAPGHFEDDTAISDGFNYPTLDQLAHTLFDVVRFYNIRSFIGFGVGAGANILLRFHLMAQHLTDGLILVHAAAAQPGWGEWTSHKLNNMSVIRRTSNFSANNEAYLLWHWFGGMPDRQPDVRDLMLQSMRSFPQANVAGFINSFITRTDIALRRPEGVLTPQQKAALVTLRCQTLLVCGDDSAHVNATVETNSRCDPAYCCFTKLSDCGGFLLDEVPDKIADTIRLFFQGLGYFPHLREYKHDQILAAARKSPSITTNAANKSRSGSLEEFSGGASASVQGGSVSYNASGTGATSASGSVLVSRAGVAASGASNASGDPNA